MYLLSSPHLPFPLGQSPGAIDLLELADDIIQNLQCTKMVLHHRVHL